MKTNPQVVRDLIEQSNKMIHVLMRAPGCRRMENNHALPKLKQEKKSCIEMEVDADGGRRSRKGWNGYRQERMCSACAALWAVSVARNHLDDQLRLELSIEAEQERSAGGA